MNVSQFFIHFFTFSLLILKTLALECYVCDRQDGNYDKCVKTVQTCGIFEDWCLSTVEWGSLPYWQIGADKMYYISKSCASKETCQRTIMESMPYCDRISYNDWKCAECCQGDRCNYYVTLAANSIHPKPWILSLTMLTVLSLWWMLTKNTAKN